MRTRWRKAVQAIRQLADRRAKTASALIVSRLDALGQIEVDESYRTGRRMRSLRGEETGWSFPAGWWSAAAGSGSCWNGQAQGRVGRQRQQSAMRA